MTIIHYVLLPIIAVIFLILNSQIASAWLNECRIRNEKRHYRIIGWVFLVLFGYIAYCLVGIFKDITSKKRIKANQ